MELRLLKYFLAVAREETISRAAEFLNLTQPTLSRQMMELETKLQTKLFTRGNRKITLTEDGILLRKRAQEIIELVEKTKSEFLISDNTISGDVYIGGGETYAMNLIAQLINSLQKEYPHIRFHLYSGNADDVTERLDKGLIDFGILIAPADISKYDSIKLPAVDIWGLLMPKNSTLTQKTVIKPEDIWDIPLISSRQTFVSNEISDWIKKDYNSLNIIATYNLVYNASLLVEEGVGYALCIDKLVCTGEDSKLSFRPLNPKLESELNIIWKKHQVFSKASEIFLKNLELYFLNLKK